eukprot:1156163-Pelagomonas_calceolata.AAC.2
MAVSIAQDPAVRITGEASSNTYTGGDLRPLSVPVVICTRNALHCEAVPLLYATNALCNKSYVQRK